MDDRIQALVVRAQIVKLHREAAAQRLSRATRGGTAHRRPVRTGLDRLAALVRPTRVTSQDAGSRGIRPLVRSAESSGRQ